MIIFASMARHNLIGSWGEKLAREYLIGKGYAIMDSNIHIGHKELDIVAIKGDRIIFVEVKTRSTDFCDPLDAIDTKKMRRLVRSADAFLKSQEIKHEPQFDIIVIIGTPESGHRLEHYPDAFIAPLSGAW